MRTNYTAGRTHCNDSPVVCPTINCWRKSAPIVDFTCSFTDANSFTNTCRQHTNIDYSLKQRVQWPTKITTNLKETLDILALDMQYKSGVLEAAGYCGSCKKGVGVWHQLHFKMKQLLLGASVTVFHYSFPGHWHPSESFFDFSSPYPPSLTIPTHPLSPSLPTLSHHPYPPSHPNQSSLCTYCQSNCSLSLAIYIQGVAHWVEEVRHYLHLKKIKRYQYIKHVHLLHCDPRSHWVASFPGLACSSLAVWNSHSDVSCGTHHMMNEPRPSARISYCKRQTWLHIGSRLVNAV